MTQEQLNAIQEQTKKITNPKLLEVMRTLKKCAEEKTNPEPQYQVDYIDNLMEARRKSDEGTVLAPYKSSEREIFYGVHRYGNNAEEHQ